MASQALKASFSQSALAERTLKLFCLPAGRATCGLLLGVGGLWGSCPWVELLHPYQAPALCLDLHPPLPLSQNLLPNFGLLRLILHLKQIYQGLSDKG